MLSGGWFGSSWSGPTYSKGSLKKLNSTWYVTVPHDNWSALGVVGGDSHFGDILRSLFYDRQTDVFSISFCFKTYLGYVLWTEPIVCRSQTWNLNEQSQCLRAYQPRGFGFHYRVLNPDHIMASGNILCENAIHCISTKQVKTSSFTGEQPPGWCKSPRKSFEHFSI